MGLVFHAAYGHPSTKPLPMRVTKNHFLEGICAAGKKTKLDSCVMFSKDKKMKRNVLLVH
jgi:hypothetical protein